MRVTKTEKTEEINFLASARVQSFTHQIEDAGVTANSVGRKIVSAGTIYPANDATAEGIVYTDVDVTDGPQPGSLIVEAYILEERLPVAPSVEAKAALTEIKFR